MLHLSLKAGFKTLPLGFPGSGLSANTTYWPFYRRFGVCLFRRCPPVLDVFCCRHDHVLDPIHTCLHLWYPTSRCQRSFHGSGHDI